MHSNQLPMSTTTTIRGLSNPFSDHYLAYLTFDLNKDAQGSFNVKPNLTTDKIKVMGLCSKLRIKYFIQLHVPFAILFRYRFTLIIDNHHFGNTALKAEPPWSIVSIGISTFNKVYQVRLKYF